MGEGTVYSHLVGPGWSCVFVGPAPKENGPIHRFERSRIVSAPPAARTAEALSWHVPLPVLMGPLMEPPALMPAVPFCWVVCRCHRSLACLGRGRSLLP